MSADVPRCPGFCSYIRLHIKEGISLCTANPPFLATAHRFRSSCIGRERFISLVAALPRCASVSPWFTNTDKPAGHSMGHLSVFAASCEGKMVADSCLRKDLYPPRRTGITWPCCSRSCRRRNDSADSIRPGRRERMEICSARGAEPPWNLRRHAARHAGAGCRRRAATRRPRAGCCGVSGLSPSAWCWQGW